MHGATRYRSNADRAERQMVVRAGVWFLCFRAFLNCSFHIAIASVNEWVSLGGVGAHGAVRFVVGDVGVNEELRKSSVRSAVPTVKKPRRPLDTLWAAKGFGCAFVSVWCVCRPGFTHASRAKRPSGFGQRRENIGLE